MSIKDNFKVLIDFKKSWFDSFYVFLYYWHLIFSVYFVTMVPITLWILYYLGSKNSHISFITLVPITLCILYYLGSKNSLYSLLPCSQELSVSFISLVTRTLCILYYHVFQELSVFFTTLVTRTLCIHYYLDSKNSFYFLLPWFKDFSVSLFTLVPRTLSKREVLFFLLTADISRHNS